METNNLKPFLVCSGISAIIGIVLGLITLIAMKHDSSSYSRSMFSNSDDTTVVVESSGDYDESAPFSAELTGTVGGSSIQLEFTYHPDSNPNVQGRDTYTGDIFLDLTGSYDPTSGRLNMDEIYNGDVTGSISGTLSIDRDSNRATYSGEFTNSNGHTYDFVLEGSLR